MHHANSFKTGRASDKSALGQCASLVRMKMVCKNGQRFNLEKVKQFMAKISETIYPTKNWCNNNQVWFGSYRDMNSFYRKLIQITKKYTNKIFFCHSFMIIIWQMYNTWMWYKRCNLNINTPPRHDKDDGKETAHIL